jgi:hypothetical protein
MIKPRRAAFDAHKYNPSHKSKAKSNFGNKFTVRALLASTSLSLLMFGYIYEGIKWREVDIEIANVMEAVARRSNPCFSYQKLEITADFIKSKGLDTGNTAIIPDSPLYKSEGENTSVDNWYNQVLDSVSLYKGLCDQLVSIEPKIGEYEEDEKTGELNYRNLKKINPKLNDKILTADFSNSSVEIDNNLVTPKHDAVIPENLHLMPYLRQFLMIRYLSFGILFLCYFGPALSFLSSKKTFKFGFNLLNHIAPWRL